MGCRWAADGLQMGCNKPIQDWQGTVCHWHPPLQRSSRGEQFMSLISLIITLIVVGVLLWLVNNYIPMDGKIKRILNIVVVVAVVVWLLNLLGLMDSLRGIRVGR
jgi:UDP-N-acetylmuramyl pentapeptide phosphotransferase/UDP-N-acetylglucosamine-1-phosphate transferase